MQKQSETKREQSFVAPLSELEDLAEKKTKIYSRLLMDAALAKDMEKLSERHQKRKSSLKTLLSGEKEEDEDEA